MAGKSLACQDCGHVLNCARSSNNNQQQRDFVDFEARDDVSAAFNLAMQGPGLPVAYKGPDGVWRKFGCVYSSCLFWDSG